MNKYFKIISLVGVVIFAFGIASRFFVYPNNRNTDSLVSEIKTEGAQEINAAIAKIQALPEVQEFIATVEEKYNDSRRVSFQVREADNKEYFVVTVAESDEIKETTWKIFQVKKDGSEILVVNSVTGELDFLISNDPSDFSITYEIYDYENFSHNTLVVTSTGAWYKVRGMGSYEDYFFPLNTNQVQILLKTFADNQFSSIKTHSKDVSDRGGTAITYQANGITIIKSDNSTSFINTDGSHLRYAAIVKVLNGIIEQYDQKKF